MRRREFITLLGGAAATASPLAARAQPSANRVRRVAILFSGPESEGLPVLREALARFGWEEGRNLQIDWRAALADLNLARTYTRELVGMKPDVIVATNAQMVKSVQDVSSTIPIVFLNVPDSVLTELVGSVSRPNRNATGFINFDSPMAGK
jgi:putative ABC transport system substrate-binding protein